MTWLLRTIGVDEDFLARLDQVTPAAQYPMVLVLGGVLLVPLAWAMYHRQRHNLASASPRLIGFLTATRIAMLALLVIVLAGPYLKLDYQSERRPIVALLLDRSDSMSLPVGAFPTDAETTRMAAAAGYAANGGKVDPQARKSLAQQSRGKLAQAALEASASALL